MLYHAQDLDDKLLTNDSARALNNNKRVTDIDCEILEDESIIIYFNDIHRNMMHNDPSSWTDLSFFKDTKVK